MNKIKSLKHEPPRYCPASALHDESAVPDPPPCPFAVDCIDADRCPSADSASTIEYWRDRSEYHRVRCLRFITASRALMDCEAQRQRRQDEHKQIYGEEIWIPPQQALYQQSVACIGDVLHGINWPFALEPDGQNHY